MSAQDTTVEAPAPRASIVPTAIIGLAFLAVAVLFLWGSTWYFIFKTVHVLFAVIWIGGGALLTIYGLRAERAGDPARSRPDRKDRDLRRGEDLRSRGDRRPGGGHRDDDEREPHL